MKHAAGNIRAALAANLLICSMGAQAQYSAKDYPSKPIRILVGVTAGGGIDTTARAVAQKLTEAWGRQVVVDNRPGANSGIALEAAAKATPDGYTLCMIVASQTVNAAVNTKLPYDLVKDFAPISQITSLYYVLYHTPSLAVKSTKDLIAHAKANPGKIPYASAGANTLQHLAVELFGHIAGIKLVHVPYKGGAAAVSGSLTGEVQLGFSGMLTLRSHFASGRLRALAMTAKERSSTAPELPTMTEAGVPGYELYQWYGLMTGAKVPPAIIRKLNTGVAEAMKAPDVAQRLNAEGSIPFTSSPEAFDAFIKSEIAKWRKLAQDAKLSLS